MKKFLALILCLLMTLSVLTACGSTASTATEQPAAEAEAPAAEAEAPAAEEAPAEEAPAEIAHKETLVIGTAEDINNLNLQTQKTANNNIILKNRMSWYALNRISIFVKREALSTKSYTLI